MALRDPVGTMSAATQFSPRNKEAFLAALDRIAAANREPQQLSWQAPGRLTVEGLRDALVELAQIGNTNGRAARIT